MILQVNVLEHIVEEILQDITTKQREKNGRKKIKKIRGLRRIHAMKKISRKKKQGKWRE